jgi:F-type H+-transporting ATPase subunit a
MGEESEVHAVLWSLGPLQVTVSIAITWLIMAILGLLSLVAKLSSSEPPGRLQTVAEAIVCTIEDAVRSVIPRNYSLVMPFVATLWLFLVPANLAGLVPGLGSPTADLSVTAALAILVFFSVHWFGVKSDGWKRYLLHFLQPSPILLPLHIISEITRTAALAVRLFGNIMSMEMAALIMLLVAGFLMPVPILMLHVVEALVQAYIFGTLALIFIAGGISTHNQRSNNRSVS